MARQNINDKKSNKKNKPIDINNTSIGRLFKSTREQKGYSLQDIYSKTKISKEILMAIEDERFEVLPSITHLRGFVTQYANVLGLDKNQILSFLPKQEVNISFVERKPVISMVNEPLGGISSIRDKEQKNDSEEKGVSAALLTFLVLVFLALLASYVASQEDSKQAPPSPSAQEISTYDVSG